MNYIIADEPRVRVNLLPFTFTRPVCEIRIGILTVREKWEYELGTSVSFQTETYLSSKFPLALSPHEDNVWINGAVLPSSAISKQVKDLKKGEALAWNNILIALHSGNKNIGTFVPDSIMKEYKVKPYATLTGELLILEHLWDIFYKNGEVLQDDFARVRKNKNNVKVPSTNVLIGNHIYIEEGAKLQCAILNSESGPIYVGKNVEIMEGAIIKGPVALCEGAVVKAGAKIYGPTTIGPYSKVGGELNNVVIFGYSNKAHDGFLGNAVIGEWCNLGADTNNSNLKNNYSVVKIQSYADAKEISTGLTFCGLIMADHSKCGINTMFNTGTVAGVSANIFGAGFPKKFIPSFSWGGAEGMAVYDIQKACETAARVFERRGKVFTETDKNIFAEIYKQTQKERLGF